MSIETTPKLAFVGEAIADIDGFTQECKKKIDNYKNDPPHVESISLILKKDLLLLGVFPDGVEEQQKIESLIAELNSVDSEK